MDRHHREPEDVEYPTSDGMPMAETPWHRDQMTLLIESLRQLLADRGDAHIGGNEIHYWERGNAQKWLSPDVWMAFDLDEPVPEMGSYKLWVQGKGPDLVIESCSKSTRRNDFGPKKEKYRTLFEVSEYVVWDVDIIEGSGELDIHGLYAWRLDALGRYRPVALDDEGAFVSQVLGGARLRFDPDSRFLRVVDSDQRVMPGTAEEGRREGRREGRLEGLGDMLQAVLEGRFGPLPTWLRERIAAATTEAQLHALLVEAQAAPDLDALRDPLDS